MMNIQRRVNFYIEMKFLRKMSSKFEYKFILFRRKFVYISLENQKFGSFVFPNFIKFSTFTSECTNWNFL